MSLLHKTIKSVTFICALFLTMSLKSQGNRLSTIITGPKKLSICGINDTAAFEVYNISSGTVTSIQIRVNLPSGIRYIKGSINGGSVSESNVSNTNQPVFTAPNLSLAGNFKFKMMLSADCDLLTFLNSSNTPAITCRIDYTGNFDNGSSIPFSVNVPSVQFVSVSNLSYTGDLGTKFTRTITVGNYGKGPLREIIIKRINGKDVSTFFVDKGSSSFVSDTVYTKFGPSHFKTIGNLDTFLDQNEVIVVTDSNRIKGCKNLNTAFEVSWGCNGKNCQVSKVSGSVFISNNSPALKAIPMPVYPTCYNYNTFKSEIKFVNTGNMTAITPRIYISQNYPYTFTTIDTFSVRYKIGYKGALIKPLKDSVTGTYNQGYYGCIGLYPIGMFRIKVPDLKPNDTLYVSWDMKSCTPPSCSNASILLNGWAYYADYKDQCSNVKNIPWAWGKVYDQQYFGASNFIPTDLINNQIGEFRMYISSVALLNRSNSAKYKVDITLPKGLTHSLLKKDFYFINADLTSNWSPDSLRMYGDTLRAFFSHPVPFDLTGSELIYYLKADCSKTGANGSKTMNLQFLYNPDANCNPKEWLTLTCQNMQLKIHCFSNCAGGMKFRNFSARRISFGLPDNNNDGIADTTGSLDTLKVREERCFTGDTIMTVYTGTVKRTTSVVSWRNAYIESYVSNGRYLEVAGINLMVWRRGVTLSVNCNQIKSWKTVSGNDASFKIDLSTDSMLNCVSSSFRYSNDDSLVVKVKYRVAENAYGLILNLNFNNQFYTSSVTNPSLSSAKFQCDTFSGQMILAGYYFATCCNDIYQANSCSQMWVNNYYYLGIGACCNNYGGNNYFPYEYRHFARLKSIRFYTPQGFKYIYSQMAQYRTSGSNKTTWELKDSLYTSNLNTKPLVFDVSGNYRDSTTGKIRPSDDGFHGYFNALIEPSCESGNGGNLPFRYDFIFEKRGVLGSGYDTITGGFNEQVYYNKPVYTIQATSPIIYAAKDTAEWELVFTNYSSSFSNNNSWFSPDNSGAVKVVQIRDAATNAILPLSGDIFKVGTIGYNSSRKFKIRAIYNSCKKDSVVIYTGWNCNEYPKDLNSYNCNKTKTVLYIEPQNTQFQVSITDSSNIGDLCVGVPYRMVIENIGATAAYNTKALVNLPIGMTVISGSCYLKYPHKSSKISLPSPVLKSGTLYEWNLQNISTLISKGFKGVDDTSSNKIIIEFRVKTDCNFSSGSYIRASASGNIKCGDPVIVYSAISNPYNIKGVTRPYYTLLKVEADTLFTCEKSSKVKVKIINLGPGKTGIEDKYQILLPPGVGFDSATYLKVRLAPQDSSIKTNRFNGASEIEFGLIPDVVPGDSMLFEFGINSDNALLNCGSLDLYSQTAVKQEVICVSNLTKCKINVVTGNSLIQPLIVKGNVGFTALKSSLLGHINDSESLNLNYNIVNSGFNSASGKIIKYKIIYDANGSGTPDANDPIIFVDSSTVGLNKNGNLAFTKSIKVKAGQSCGLFVVLDSASCSCNFNYAKFPVPILKNAGPSKSLCSGDTIQLGSPKVNGYRYVWSPGQEFIVDTLAQVKAIIINNDSIGIDKQYILTTYRGQCSSKDTVKVSVFKLPQISIRQNDTGVCEGNKVDLKAVSTGGTGTHYYDWVPSGQVLNSKVATTKTKNIQSQKFKITITDAKNCKAMDSVQINIYPKPVNAFGQSKVCNGDSVEIIDSTKITGDSIRFIEWTYLKEDTTGVKRFKLNPNGSLLFDLKLRTISGLGCADTLSKKIIVHPNPDVSFNFQNVCLGEKVKFTSTSSIVGGEPINHHWFIDNNNFDTSSLDYTFNTSDTFNVALAVISNSGCSDTVFSKVEIYPLPISDFSVGDVCSGDSIHALNSSASTNGKGFASIWTYENRLDSSINLTFINRKDTSYKLNLEVVSSDGCRDTSTKIVWVNPNPVSMFTALPVCENTSTSFVSSSNIGKGTIVNYKYELSDGTNNLQSNFKHKFLIADTFQATLIIQSDKNCKDTFTNDVIVYPKINPDFTFNDTCAGFTAQFEDKSSFINTGIIERKFRFSATDSAMIVNPTFTYTQAGKYKVFLEVKSTEFCSYDTFKEINIFPIPRALYKDSNKCFDNRFSFSSESNISSGSIKNQKWTFGDLTQSNSAYTLHSFPESGTYSVKLWVISDRNCTDSIEGLATAYPPVYAIFSHQNVCLGQMMFFKDSSVVSNSNIKEFNWTFGDGGKSSLQDPMHMYKSPGKYNVELKIKTGYDCFYDSMKEVEVYPVPVADFNLDPSISNILQPNIGISDLSTGADSIFYILGDGSSTDLRNLVKAYPDSGTYKITQYALNKFGCIDSITKTLVINYMFVFNAPTAFTPNGDGKNDVYAPGGIGIDEYEMSIYNRWGELIYQSEPGVPWDGKYAGDYVMDGVYAVYFKIRDYKGRWHYSATTVTVLR
ncbi:MAG TPA: PKD domain-containing protein [Bacteroidia bacterium]